MQKNNKGWMWYPADMEIYHCMLQNFSREERGYGWPAYWHMDSWNKNVRFTRSYELTEETAFTVRSKGTGHVAIGWHKYPLNTPVVCGPGKVDIAILVGSMTGLPSVLVEGEVIHSGPEWLASNLIGEKPVGMSALFAAPETEPSLVPYSAQVYEPVNISPAISAQGSAGMLFDFGRMVTAELTLAGAGKTYTVCYGESDAEALDEVSCYYKEPAAQPDTPLRRRAFRYVFIPGIADGEASLSAKHTYVDIPVRASFRCDDELLNRIFDVSVETFRLCSGMFFIDGVKRDRWVWSGDAYQSYLVNPYIFFDREINKRTLLGLRGNLGMTQHLNTIVDYSLLWMAGLLHEYEMTADLNFIESVFPKAEELMRLCMGQTDENGFLTGRPGDWIFVDWADIDKEGPNSAEQVLLVHAYETMARLCALTGRDGSLYSGKAADLRVNLDKFFWQEQLGAYIDSYQSGKNHVTRHANIFAVLFGVASESKRDSIAQNVIMNPAVPEITTPYFKFFELDALCQLGYLDEVMARMKAYWGGMLERGAVTFWEEFDPGQQAPEQYGMYGDPFGKSLCHAWGASPIYLLGKYFLGVKPAAPGYASYEVKPELRFFKELDCQVPAGDKTVRIRYSNGKLETETF